MPTDSPTGKADDRRDMQQGEPRPPTLEEFKALCRAELNWLVAEHGFREAEEDTSPFANPFKVQFVRDDLIVSVEGIHWGRAAMFSIHNRQGRSIGVRALDPTFVPLAKTNRPPPPGQAAEIVYNARQLRTLGTRLLGGDFSAFEEAVARIDAAWAEHARHRRLSVAIQEAVAAFRLEQWPRVVELLEPHEAELSSKMARKLATARQKLAD
jgi:hypothetical protein